MKKDIGPLLVPAVKERLNEKILSQIKGLILSSHIETGQRLPSERELSRRLKVSRGVVREALRSLEQSGLIEIKAGAKGGAFVTRKMHLPLFSSVQDLLKSRELTLSHFFEGRRAIETYTVRCAAEKATPEDLERLTRINQELLKGTDDKMKLREENAAFHLTIAELSGNPLLKLILQSLFELLNRLWRDSLQSKKFVEETYKRHESLIEALKKRNISLSERLMSIDVSFTEKLRKRKLAPGRTSSLTGR